MGRHNVTVADERLPSKRYMVCSEPIRENRCPNVNRLFFKGVLTRGANEQSLPGWYQQRLAMQPTYEPGTSWWFRLGAKLFLWPWMRAGMITERLVYKYQGPEGHVPAWFLFIFDCLLWLMWAQHDFIYGPIFGRGDGR